MLNLLFKNCDRRNLSTSNVWKNVNNENKAPKPVENPTPAGASGPQGYHVDFTPSEFEKKMLVWSGKYKSVEEIPPRVSYGAIDYARSRVRIKLANILMICTLGLCGYYVWQGKKRVKEGETLHKILLAKDRKIIEDAARERELKGAK